MDKVITAKLVSYHKFYHTSFPDFKIYQGEILQTSVLPGQILREMLRFSWLEISKDGR